MSYPLGNSTYATTSSRKGIELQKSDISRILPRQLSTGTMRGTQTVGYGNAKIDGSNNVISVGTGAGDSIGMGNIPTTSTFGFFSQSVSGQLVYTNVNGTQTYYNPADTYISSILVGGAPDDGRAGIWVAKPGYSVIELLGG